MKKPTALQKMEEIEQSNVHGIAIDFDNPLNMGADGVGVRRSDWEELKKIIKNRR